MLATLPLSSASAGKMENEKRLLTFPELREGIGEKELFQLVMDFSDSGTKKVGVVVPTCSRNEANIYYAAADRFSGTFPEYLLTVYTDDKDTLQYLLDIDSLTMRLRSKTVANPDVAAKKRNTAGKNAKGFWGVLNRLFGINTEEEPETEVDLTVADTGIEDEELRFHLMIHYFEIVLIGCTGDMGVCYRVFSLEFEHITRFFCTDGLKATRYLGERRNYMTKIEQIMIYCYTIIASFLLILQRYWYGCDI